jgi:hypothetical protein
MIKSKLSSQKEFIQKTTLKKLKIVGEIKNLYTFAHSFLRGMFLIINWSVKRQPYKKL